MIRFGLFSLLAILLQLVVPSYGLRLVRRFGTQNVGWFLVAAFSCLAFVHLLEPLRPHGGNAAVGLTVDSIYAIAAALLLIGMGHIETIFSERQRAKRETERLRTEWESFAITESEAKQGLIRDIAQRDETEKSIRQSEAQYRSLFNENPQPMWIFDLRSLRFLAVNKAAVRQYGFTTQQFMTMKVSELLSSDSATAFLKDVAKPCQGIEPRGLWRHCRSDRTLIDVELTAVDMKYDNCPARLVLANDISERHRREQDLLEAQKMQTIGQLAGGAAHHLNNMLTIIDGHASLLLHKPHDATTTEQLKQISSAAGRAASLTRQLLAAGGRHLMQKEVVDLNGLVRNHMPMLRRLIGDSIALQHSFASNRAPILADPHLVEHIIVNLVLNARDSMPTGGTLTISTAPMRFEENEPRRPVQAKTGDFVCLAIQDTGCGMTPEVQARVFEPFFTTRDIGKGTGLGLASVHGAVKQHSGWVEFTSELGVGTEFRVFLPCAPSQTGTTSESGLKQEALPAVPAVRRETVLLVDPHDRVRSLARFVLDKHGYQVIEADTGPTALFLWEWQSAQIDVLLTDFKLSAGFSGPQLAKQLCEAKPGLKVVYTCDCSPDADGEVAMPMEGQRFVSKPFSPDRLVQTVEACLAT
jgi:two-component system, cell cycle sensor histidine kinase and response regulator CckA